MKIKTDEPAPGRFRYEWDEIIAAAKANPNEWVMPEKEYPHSLYAALLHGKNSKFVVGEWSFSTSGTRYDIKGKRWCHLHFKYDGPKEESNT